MKKRTLKFSHRNQVAEFRRVIDTAMRLAFGFRTTVEDASTHNTKVNFYNAKDGWQGTYTLTGWNVQVEWRIADYKPEDAPMILADARNPLFNRLLAWATLNDYHAVFDYCKWVREGLAAEERLEDEAQEAYYATHP